MLRGAQIRLGKGQQHPEAPPFLHETQEWPRFSSAEEECGAHGEVSAVQQKACSSVSGSFSPADLICGPSFLQRYPEPMKDESPLVPRQEHRGGGSVMAEPAHPGGAKLSHSPPLRKCCRKFMSNLQQRRPCPGSTGVMCGA